MYHEKQKKPQMQNFIKSAYKDFKDSVTFKLHLLLDAT